VSCPGSRDRSLRNNLFPQGSSSAELHPSLGTNSESEVLCCESRLWKVSGLLLIHLPCSALKLRRQVTAHSGVSGAGGLG